MTYFLAQFPNLSVANVSAYVNLYANITLDELEGPVAMFEGFFALPEPTSANELENLWAPFWAQVNKTYPDQTATKTISTIFPNFYSMFLQYADASVSGVDKVVGSWLLPPGTLTDDALINALVDFVGESGGRLMMVSGKGVWNAEPRGGSNAVNPAWRKALIHAGESSCIV